MVCEGCGKEIHWYESHNRCPECYSAYEYMIEHPTEQIKALLGDNVIFLRYEEDFLPLVAIQRQKMEGKISDIEAKSQTEVEWERIRKRRNPTPEEFEECRRKVIAERHAVAPSVYDDLFK